MPLRERAPNLIGDGPTGPPPRVQVHLPNTLVYRYELFEFSMSE